MSETETQNFDEVDGLLDFISNQAHQRVALQLVQRLCKVIQGCITVDVSDGPEKAEDLFQSSKEKAEDLTLDKPSSQSTSTS